MRPYRLPFGLDILSGNTVVMRQTSMVRLLALLTGFLLFAVHLEL